MHTINQAANKPYKYWIEQYDALERLMHNKDFKTVFLDGYLTDNVLLGVKLLASESVPKEKVIAELDAISYLEAHLQDVRVLGESAKQDQIEEED